MGLRNAWKKKRAALAKNLEDAAKRANDFLDEAAGTKPLADGQPSFLDKLNLAASNMQQAALQMQQYDYEVETKDEDGRKISKVTMRHKTTGEIVSNHSQIQEQDGTIRVSSTGKASNMMIMNQGDLPPNFPKENSSIEYKMVKKPDDDFAVVKCTVKDGPQAGKTLEYKAQEGSEGNMTYVLVRETQSTRKMSFLAIIGILFAVAMSMSAVWDGLCMPVAPWLPLSYSERSYEAPWWVPPSAKPDVFGLLCGDRPRTVVTYEKGQLSIRQADKPQTTLHKKSGVQQAILSPSRVTMTTSGQKTVVLQAPWSS